LTTRRGGDHNPATLNSLSPPPLRLGEILVQARVVTDELLHRGIPPYPETLRYVQRVLGRAGMGDSIPTSRPIYRYSGPDDTVVYSNLPPLPRSKDRRR